MQLKDCLSMWAYSQKGTSFKNNLYIKLQKIKCFQYLFPFVTNVL